MSLDTSWVQVGQVWGGVGVGGVGWCGVSYLLLCSGEEQQTSTDTAAGLQPKSLKCDE